MLKFSSKIAAFLLIFSFMPTIAFAQEAFDITNYTVDIAVTDDRVYHINETIDTFFNESRHGIYRKIPETGTVEDYKIRDIDVSFDDYSTSTENGYKVIKIGDPDRKIDGEHTYYLSYSLRHIKDDATDGDYAYINLIGTEWDTSIANAQINITLPTSEIEEITLTSGYNGSSENSNNAVYNVSENVITVTAQNLSNYEGITIMVKMPEGTFYAAPDNFYPGADLFALGFSALSIILLCLSLTFYFRHGKDKDVLPVVEFYPPDDMNPAEIGYIIDKAADSTDVTSLVLYWASKGLLTFEQGIGDNYTLYKQKDIDESSPAYEKKAFKKLWSCGNGSKVTNSDLKDTYYKTVNTAKLSIPGVFTGKRELNDKKSSLMAGVSVFLAMLSVFLPSLVAGFYSDRGLTYGLTTGGGCAFFLVFIHGVIKAFDNSRFKKKLSSNIVNVLIIIFFSVMYVPFASIAMDPDGIFNYIPTLFITLVAVLISICSVFVNKRSEYGHTILERTIGFKEFLETAEKDKLETLLEETPSYFYDILPYALTLNVTDKWADKFEDLITEPPEWYYTTRGGRFRTSDMYKDLNRSMRRMRNDMTSSPSSGGSSGSFGCGGRSGGGSGGGGGGSW